MNSLVPIYSLLSLLFLVLTLKSILLQSYFPLLVSDFFSLIFLFQQFFSLGFAFHSLVEKTSLKTAYSYFAGHGIVEIINMFFTAAIGLFVAVCIVNMIRKKELNKNSFILLGKNLLVLLIIDLLLLLVAALLETYLSPSLVDKSYII